MFKIKFFLTVYLEKIAVLVLCSSSRHLSFLRFICSALLLLPAALLSSAHLHLSSHPFSCSSIFLSSAQHFFCALSSPLGSLSSFHLSDLSCGSRGLIYSPNILNCTCAHARKEKPTHIFHRLPDLNVIWATFSLSESKRELCPTSQPACAQQIWI